MGRSVDVQRARLQTLLAQGSRIPFSNSTRQEAVLVLFIVGLELYEGKFLFFTARRKFDIVRYVPW